MQKEKRLLNGFAPKDKGCQLLSRKVRPNDKCLCNSGKKQKHCCGTDTRYLSTDRKKVSTPTEKDISVEKALPSPKHLLIIGPPKSGKTKRANEIAAEYSKNEVCYFSMFRKRTVSDFFFDGCTEQTKLIIIDEIKSIKHLYNFFDATEGITVNTLGKPTINIHPRIICISEFIKESDIPVDASFVRRFEVINLAN